MYSVMWDDVFLTSNTVSYEHKSLILDKPFCCLLKYLWKVVGEGSKYQGTPQIHWLDVGRVGGFCRITARAGWGESRASSRPAVPCKSTRVSCFLNRWLILLSPATTAVIKVLLLLPRTDEKLENTFNTSVAVGSQAPVGVSAVRKKTAVLAFLELTL